MIIINVNELIQFLIPFQLNGQGEFPIKIGYTAEFYKHSERLFAEWPCEDDITGCIILNGNVILTNEYYNEL